MENSGTPVNTAPWGKFLEKLLAIGVTVEYTASKFAYLRREVDGRTLAVPLPSKFDADDPDRCGYVGCYVFDNVCRRLEIEKHVHFKGWYLVL